MLRSRSGGASAPARRPGARAGAGGDRPQPLRPARRHHHLRDLRSPAGVGALEQLSQAIAAVAAFPRIGRGLHRRARTPAPDQRGADGRLGLPARFGNDRFSIQAAKIFVDGGRDGAFRSTQMTCTAEEWGILTPQPRSS